MRNFMRNRFLLFHSFFQPLEYQKSIFSTVISKNAIDLETIWTDFNKQFHPYPKDFQFGRAVCNRKIHIHHEVVGRSKIEVSIHIKSEYFPENILLKIFKGFINKQINWESDRIQEFIEFLKGAEFHESYIENKNIKEPFIAPNAFLFQKAYIWNLKLPHQLFPTFLPNNLQPKIDSLKNVKVQAMIIPIDSIRYDLWEEELITQIKAELIDLFIEVFETYPKLKVEPFFVYLGSIYSHREIGSICKKLNLERKMLPNNFKKYFMLPGKKSGLKEKLTINPLCRIRDYNNDALVSRINNESTLFCIQRGVYSLSKNEMDHAPIEKTDLFF
jgi:hypothetical protein